MHWYLREVVRPRLDEHSEMLEVGSSRVAVQYLCSEAVIGKARYTAIDVRALSFHADIDAPHRFIRMDVTSTNFADAIFDVILCNHTLPYVRDDRRALGELFRCLRPDGLAMLDSSHDAESTQTVAEYRRQHPELGEEYFAENGDEWVYGPDYFERLEEAGFQVRVDTLFDGRDAEYSRQHGLKDHHELIVAFKSPEGARRFPPPAAGSPR